MALLLEREFGTKLVKLLGGETTETRIFFGTAVNRDGPQILLFLT
ncbi:MAG: hypothetical protein WCE52_00430 [Candidatus Acidiferrum sp.]